MAQNDSYKMMLQDVNFLRNGKKYSEALKRALEMKAKFPDEIEINSIIGFIYMLMGDFQKADDIIEDGIKIHPEYINNYIVYTDSAFWKKDFEEALSRSLRISELFPERFEGHSRAGNAYKNLKRYSQAEAMYEKAIANNDKIFDIQFQYATLALELDNLDLAESRFKKLLEKFPDHPESYSKLGFVYMRQGRFDDADLVTEDAMRKFPHNINNYIINVDSAIWRKDFKEALSRSLIMLRIFPDNSSLYGRLATVYMNLQMYPEAEDMSKKEMGTSPLMIDGYAHYADIAMRQNNYDEAIIRWKNVITKFPQNPLGYASLGFTYMRLRRFRESDEITKTGIEMTPDSINCYVVNIDSAMWQKDYPAALQRALTMCEKFPDAWEGYDRAAQAYMNLAQYDIAEEASQQAIEKAPQIIHVYVTHAKVAMHKKDYESALSRWTNVINKFPKMPIGYERVSHLHDRIFNDRLKAEEICETALEKVNDKKSIYIRLIDTALRYKDLQRINNLISDCSSLFFSDIITNDWINVLERVFNLIGLQSIQANNELFKISSNIQELIDKSFINLCDQIIEKNGLIKNHKIALITDSGNVGDNFFAFSAKKYLDKKLSAEHVFIMQKDSPSHQLAQLFDKCGFFINKILIDENIYKLNSLISQDTRNKYKGIIEHGYQFADSSFFNHGRHPDVKQNLVELNSDIIMQNIDKDYYINKFGIIPGKTVLLIPEARWHGPLPDYTWKMIIKLFDLIGLKVIINSKNIGKYGNQASYIFPSILDLIPITQISGYVFGIRSGLIELLSASTPVNRTIICVQKMSLKSWYPYLCKNDHNLKEYFLNDVRTSGFHEIDEFLRYLMEPYLQNPIESIPSLDKIQEADVLSSIMQDNRPIFMVHPREHWVDNFCSAKYSQKFYNGFLHLRFFISPSYNYIIHVGLINLSINQIVQEFRFINSNSCAFKIKDDGLYTIIVRIIHPFKKIWAHFETDPVKIKLTWQEKLSICADYYQYIELLKMNMQAILIFIVSTGILSAENDKKKLNLQKINIHSNPQEYHNAGYLAVIDSGKLVFEQTSISSPINYSYKWDNNEAQLLSRGNEVNGENQSMVSVKINGEEQAVNLRGLNFVVWDKKNNCLVDSVAFDTFTEDNKDHRLNPTLKMTNDM